jgi:para-nitrobenzyl esterase
VVINVNYRLGAFGFLATEELAEETEDGSYGNYGIADAAAGLEWVQENIAGFGGDPDNVTIFGESAGGGAVCALLAAPAWNELFDRAIVQSGGTCNRLDDGEEAKDAGADLVEDLGCEDIACMRELDTETITSYFDGDESAVYEEPELWRGNVIADGVRFTDTARDRAEAGELDGIQIINGSNADEAWLFTLNIEEDFDDEELADVFSRFTDDTEALLALYPAEDYDDNLGRFVDMWTETSFTCPILTFAEVAQNDTYVYNYSFQSEKLGIPPAHGIELVHLFGHPEGISAFEPGLEGADAELSEAMQQAWVSFATDGDPGEGWQPYGEDGLITVLDKVPLETTDEIREGRCDAVTDLTHTSANLL